MLEINIGLEIEFKQLKELYIANNNLNINALYSILNTRVSNLCILDLSFN